MCQEVQRRLGPDSMVTKQMYKSFVAEVLHKTVVNKAPVCLREFVWGQVVSMLVLPGSLEIFRKLLKLFFFVLNGQMVSCFRFVSNLLGSESRWLRRLAGA